MRNISFSLTTPQFLNRTKSVTRRLGWKFLNAGDRLMACKKCVGLKPGEKSERLGEIEVVSVRRELLCDITEDDVFREGFAEASREWFILHFMQAMKCKHNVEVTRIEFKHGEAD